MNMNNMKIEDRELLELQRKYRNGHITEKEIPKDKLEKLKELYNNQIKFLEYSIEEDKKEILKIRKGLYKNN